MKILNLKQGSPEWHEHRAKARNSSEAPAMMCASKYMKRSELLEQKATGIIPEPGEELQALFDRGHAAERKARPIAEKLIGKRLYPLTCASDDGYLSASLDGRTMVGEWIWEHKLFSKPKADYVEQFGAVPDTDFWQVVQGLSVSGAKACLYTLSDGTEANAVHLIVLPPDGEADCPGTLDESLFPVQRLEERDFDELRAGWAQFDRDVAEWSADDKPKPEPEVVGAKVGEPKALSVMVGSLTVESNVDEFRDHAMNVLSAINTDLQTDQDFADAAEALKFCEDVEARCKQARESAVSQAEPLQALFDVLDEIQEAGRQKRLTLTKLRKGRVDEIKHDLQKQAEILLLSRSSKAAERMGLGVEPRLSRIDFRRDVADAMKGKRTISAFREAAEGTLASWSQGIEQQVELVDRNLKYLADQADGLLTLFPDIRQLAHRDHEGFRAEVDLRIVKHERETEEAEKKRQRDREDAAMASQEAAKAVEPTAPPADKPREPTPPPEAPPADSSQDIEPMSIGQINKLISPLTVTAAGLKKFGLEPSLKKGNSCLYQANGVDLAIQSMISALECARASTKRQSGA